MNIELALQLNDEWKAAPSEIDELPPRLPLSALKTLPEIYQPRMRADTGTGVTNKSHVKDLKRTLRNPKADLDPITVLRIGQQNIVIDGHHRAEAYRTLKSR